MAAKKSRGLGRGLDALFGDMEVDILKNDNEDTPKVEESSTDANKPSAGSAAKRTAGSSENAAKAAESDGSVQNVDPAAGGILYIDINDIKPNTNQPRKVFDEEKLEDLAASIQEHGLIQPEVLRSVGAGYEIVAGERRWRAARKAGVRNIPCIVRELSDEENISQGIGIREGLAYGESRAFRQPTTVYDEDKVVREIDGVRLELVRLPGETDDQIMIWLPERQVLCCGDNYYGCWPNLYAIRGSQYRDIAGWLDSLDEILSYSATYLLPGHTRPLCGKEEVRSVLTGFRDAIRYVLEKTLAGMNEGKDIDTLASEIVLPQEYASLPYLGEYYGCVEWTVRAIFTAYLGWFDGNPTNLHPLPPKERAEKAVALAGGADAVLRAAEEAVRKGECQWCLELCDLLLTIGVNAEAARRQKAVALTKLAAYETSANGRHYYLVCAHELENRH